MKILNLHKEVLTPGWTVTRLSPKIEPTIPGLAACFVVKGTFKLRRGEPAIPLEGRPEFPNGDKPMKGKAELGIGYASDFVPYKPNAEFLVVGTAHSPEPDQVAYPVRVRVGELKKSILAVGVRRWRNSFMGAVPGDPAPAGNIPLSYSNAWGAKDDPRNPLGRGKDSDELPTLELYDSPIEGKNSRVQPAGFAPIPPSWPQRSSKMGTYDQDYLAESWPWWPHDFDWSYFNAAPPNQWNDSYWRGDEEIELENLHPEHRVYRSQLPKLRARCFLLQEIDGREDFREVPLELDTIWIDADDEKLVLAWRGRTPIASLKLREARYLLLLSEPLEASPRPLSEVRQLLDDAIAARKPAQPAPPAFQVDVKKKVAEMEAKFAEQFKQLDGLEQQAAQHKAAALAELEKRGVHLPPEQPQQSLEEIVASLHTSFAKIPPTETTSAEDLQKLLSDTEAQVRELHGMPEQMMKEFAPMLAALEARKKAAVPGGIPIDVAAAKANGFAGQRMDGQDFSGLDLEGVDFSGASLRQAKFVGTKLKGAKFVKSTLTASDFSGAELTGANFTSAELVDGKFVGTTWKGVILDSANLSGTQLGAADFTGVRGISANLAKAQLSGARLAGTDLSKANFVGADICGADFTGAKLIGARFAEVRAHKAIFADADLTAFRGPRKADFTEADFRRVKADQSLWKGSVFDRANLQQGFFHRAQFSECSFVGATLDRGDFSNATFEDSVLTGAIVTHANLLRTVLNRTDFTSADLSGSNLYDSGMWDTIWLHAKWPGAIVTKTQLAT